MTGSIRVRERTSSDPIGWIPGANGDPRLVWRHDSTGVRTNALVIFGDTIATLGEWAEALDVNPRTVARRIRHGWTVIDALAGQPRYEHDPEARRFVLEHPRGASLAAVGEFFGVTRERIRQIQVAAAAKAEAWLVKNGFDLKGWLYSIQQRTDQFEGERVSRTGEQNVSMRLRAQIAEVMRDGEWWTSIELAEALGRSQSNVTVNLTSMEIFDLVEVETEGPFRYYRLADDYDDNDAAA